ncbi:MAG: hypothetical protein ACLPPF_21060 [Rhodomicrobium sp.]
MKAQLLKALGLLILFIALVHLFILFRTGHFDPCEAAFAKLELQNINYSKYKRRELDVDEEQQPLYDQINRRDILHCYKIAVF